MDFDVRNILISISSKGIDSILIDNKNSIHMSGPVSEIKEIKVKL